MAYLALYRAFRPETLDEVVRQEHVVKILRNQIQQDKVGHAYLFCGPRGTGKTSIAKIFARSINCLSPVNGSPCGHCTACAEMKAGSSLDVLEIDAASNNGVDEMRELREKVQYPPVSGKYKVYIIDEVHMLSVGAFNALLKTLEEPPKHAVFILATTEAQKIPATILSRCMRFDFKLIPQSDLEAHLRRVLDSLGKTYEDEAVAAIARAGNGSVRDMLSIADMCVSYESGKLTYQGVNAVLGSADFSAMAELCGQMLAGDGAAALTAVERILSEGKSAGLLSKDILQFIHQCSVAKTCRDAQKILALPSDIFAEVKEIASKTEGARLLRTSEIFAETESRLRYSASPRIVLETAVLKASVPSTDYDPEALLSRIAALEKQIAEGVPVAAPPQKTPVSSRPMPQEEKKEERSESAFVGDEFPPLEEEPVFDNGFFGSDMAPMPVSKPIETKKQAPMPEVKTERRFEPPMPEPKAAEPPKASVGAVDRNKAFGLFLRSLRKNSRNGVLFTMCSELDSGFEGDRMIFFTESETIYRSLNRPEHRELVGQALQAIGVTDFDIRIRGGKTNDTDDVVKQLKKDFPNTPFQVR